MNSSEWTEELQAQADDYQRELDRMQRQHDSEIEEMQSEMDALEKQNADLRALLAEANTRNAALMAQQMNSAHALVDYQDVAHVQADVLASFKADLEAQRELVNAYRDVFVDILAADDVDSCQHARNKINELMSKQVV